jgi:hypothetical protein
VQKCAGLEEPQKEKNQLEKAESEKLLEEHMKVLEKERLKENQLEKVKYAKRLEEPIQV